MRIVAILLAAVALCAGCGSAGKQGSKAASSSKLVDLKSVDQLRSMFNDASGVPRLIVIISPT